MGCLGDREKGPTEYTQKWDFITLSEFKSTSPWTYVAYAWLWFMALVSVAVYAVDTFTAVNLLVFNKWSSQIKPTIPFQYSKWIFAVCILLSWVLCVYGWLHAIRIVRRGGVAESYMAPLAVTLQSMRSQGWRRFIVFTDLTRSKKGADYVAFFVYFAFNGAVRVILAEGPRQAVNAMTLYAVMTADLLIEGKTNSFSKFWSNVETLAKKNDEQAIILSSMLFTLIIWVFSAISLICAATLYLVFLWHYIPQADARLSVYCRRKIDRRLEKIVEHKVKAAAEDEERKRQKSERKAELKRQKTGELPPAKDPQTPQLARQPTLPQLDVSPELKQEEKMPDFSAPLTRQNTSTTVSTLPRYESRPPTRNESQRTFHSGNRPPMPSRQGTQGSAWSNHSYESDAPLLSNAGYAGEGAPAMPMPAFDRQTSNASSGRPRPARTMTQGTQATQRSFTPVSRDGSMHSRPPPGPRGPPMRSNTGTSFETEPQSAISPFTPEDGYGRQTPFRQNTMDSFRTAPVRQASQASSFRQAAPTPRPMDRRPTFESLHSQQSSSSRPMPRKPSEASNFSPAFPPAAMRDPLASAARTTANTYELTAQRSYTQSPITYQQPMGNGGSGYLAFNPSMNSASSTPTPSTGPTTGNITVGGVPGSGGNYFGQVREGSAPQRSATAPINPRHTTGYGDILDGYSDPMDDISPTVTPAGPQRSATAGPEGGW